MKCMKRKRVRTLTKCLEQDLGRKTLGCEDFSKSEEFGSRERERERERFLLRKRVKNEI